MLKLYSAQICPFAHRCRLALSLIGVDHERIEIDLSAMPDWYLALSPNRKVPLLEHEGHKIWESNIINEYLADCFPAQGLLQADPLRRARARLAIDWAGNQVIPVFYQVLRDQPEAADRLTAALQQAPDWMSPDGPFWLGDRPGLADASIYPWFERWQVLRHYRGLKLQAPPRLQQWLEAMSNHPAVQAEVGPDQLYLKGYQRYTVPSV